MKKENNKGFIAISLIYSFFLVFLMTLLTIVSNYAYNRILLNGVKKTIQEKLNNLSEFSPIRLNNRAYVRDEIINYANESWKVIEDKGNSVVLILGRSLINSELTAGLTSNYQNVVVKGNTTSMCYNGYDPFFCFFRGNEIGGYKVYSWEDSFVKKIVENWFGNNAQLQKAKARDALNIMSFQDGNKSTIYSEYVRIPIIGEYINDNTIWTLTYASSVSNQSYVYLYGQSVPAHTTYKEVKPVIMVEKETTI